MANWKRWNTWNCFQIRKWLRTLGCLEDIRLILHNSVSKPASAHSQLAAGRRWTPLMCSLSRSTTPKHNQSSLVLKNISSLLHSLVILILILIPRHLYCLLHLARNRKTAASLPEGPFLHKIIQEVRWRICLGTMFIEIARKKDFSK